MPNSHTIKVILISYNIYSWEYRKKTNKNKTEQNHNLGINIPSGENWRFSFMISIGLDH